MRVIEVENLTKDYGSGRGVFDVNLHVDKGEIFGFLGPNGAGKSTTIRHLMGFSRPDSGKVEIFGEPTFQKYYDVLKKVGYIPGEIALPAGLTGNEFLKMMQDLTGVKNEERIEMLSDLFELDSASLLCDVKRMSLGVKRKLAVVTAFMNDPDILILDEPTSGLDLAMQQTFIEFIKEEKKRGKTILLSSHIFSEVDATCDRIAIIKDGKIVSEFIANDLKHNNNKNYLIEFSTNNYLQDFIKSNTKTSDFKIVNVKDNSLIVNIDDKKINSLINAISQSNIKGFTHLKETLEDYFMKYYKEDKDFGGALQ